MSIDALTSSDTSPEFASEVPAYAGNPLIEACGPILGPDAVGRKILRLPPLPGNLTSVPNHIRHHQLMAVGDVHVPTQCGIELAMTMDRMLRQSYLKRKPQDPATWSYIYGLKSPAEVSDVSLLCASVVGASGTGKSVACERVLSMYPQVVKHPRFPHVAAGFQQLLWLKVDVPASGRLVDLAQVLMMETNDALNEENFAEILRKSVKRGPDLWNLWFQRAKSCFLGILVLDEIQNLFRLDAREKRRQAKSRTEQLELKVVEDEALKNILTLSNTGRMAVLALGTQDGMTAFSKRFSTGQRLSHCGFHHFARAGSADDQFYKDYYFPALCRYLWADRKLESSDAIRVLLHELSGGVPRIRTALWIHAHRCMWERMGSALEIQDFERAMRTYLAPLIPAIDALNSQDPVKLARYEDLLPRDFSYFAEMANGRMA